MIPVGPLSVTAICDRYAWLYTSLLVPAGTWDHVLPVDRSYCALKKAGGFWYLMFRGSVTDADWISNFKDCAVMYDDAILGGVHPGFRDGVLAVKAQIDAIVGDDPVIVCGHSRGAGLAAIYAGYRGTEHKPLAGGVVFGEPRPGGPKLVEILAPYPWLSYRNTTPGIGHDEVTNVPFATPLLPYQHPRALIDCRADPPGMDEWGPLAWHHFYLYCRSQGCGGKAALSLTA